MGSCVSQQADNSYVVSNRNINKLIKEDEKKLKTEVKLLLLGAGESGKSTILKQMRLIHAAGFTNTERETYRSIVFTNITESMSLILESMEYFKIPFSDSENSQYLSLFHNPSPSIVKGRPFPIQYLNPLATLWADSGVQSCYEKGHQYALQDNMSYFFESLERLFSKTYIPTDQDILRCRMKTTGIVETVFQLSPLTYRMFDVGGQRSERKKWIHCFENVTAVLFIVAISGYDQCLVEDKDANQMQEALMLFDSICNSQWFVNTSMILFLNKIDIFREKIKNSSVKKYFPDYTGPDEDFKQVTHYFKRKFQRLNRSVIKEIYPHFTNATDTNLLRHIMRSVTDMIENLSLLRLDQVIAIIVGVSSIIIIKFLLFRNEVVKFVVEVPIEAKPGWNGGKILDKPCLKDASNPGYITCYDPATGQLLDTIRAHTKDDVKEALKKARDAQQNWVKTTFSERKRVLYSLLNFIIKNQEEICWVSSRDTGKTLVDGKFGEILVTCEKIRWIIKHGEKALATEYRGTSPVLPHKLAKIEYQPLGVVTALVSWNYPFHNVFGPIISSLFVGNGILIKSSEQVAWSMQFYSKIIKTCLMECGHDPDIVQFLCGFPEFGEAVVRSGVDGITFVGSCEVGKQVMKAASDNLTPCILELGGKDCAIIRHDANLSQALPITMRGTFQNAGQNCVGLERILIHESLYDGFVVMVTEQIKKLKVGSILNDDDIVDIGAMTMSGQGERLQNLIQASVSEGAKLVLGGRPFTHPKYPTAQYFEPTLLIDVTPNMTILKQELFAPIMIVMKFSTDEEAIEICNSSPFGLGNSVFSGDQNKGEWMARRLRCGMVNVNDFGATYLCNLPFGGVGISGFGR
ncbi:16903_t:CDS:10 [Funneliformis mosseae]|uniref:Guanine nucleotide-binding protein alpha-2 subunit n=1 Tax=Funneliformis mosseae TaxID=27381 RepID=A0A9N9AHH3_FUNMO|nr:16903_t:CDS:10 [Funneliformis mosseae]